MLNVKLPEALESAVALAAKRAGLSIDDYLTAVCTEALSLDVDRARVRSYLTGTPGVPHASVNEWLDELAEGKRAPCPR
jgi:hypothetical protein